MRKIFSFAPAILSAVALGCGGDSSSPSAPPPPTIPNAIGTYTAGTFWTMQLVDSSGTNRVRCGGRITIDSQNGNAISGSLVIAPPNCSNGAGPFRGTILAGGAVRIGEGTGRLHETIASLNGCVVVQATDSLTGSLTGNTLSVGSGSTWSCPWGRVNFNLDGRGTR